MELNKYLEHHNLSKQGTKEDKIKRIACHYLRGNRVTINNKNNRSTSLSGRNSSTESDSNSENEDSDGKNLDEDDEVIIDGQDVDSDDSDDSQSEESNLVDDDDDDDDDNDIVFQKTRRGRQAGSWRNAVLRKRTQFLLLQL